MFGAEMKVYRPVWRGAQSPGLMVLLVVCVLLGIVRPAAATPQLNPACPLNFFTNVASRLLSSQLKVNLNHIQIYPTNQYTPAVHRLLQVTANILDATTTNYYPSVFRPLFWKTNEECGGIWQTNIYVVGYQYVQEPLSNANSQIFSAPMDIGDARMPFGLSGMTNNIYGVPWVIGVKKGLPNFNALELDNCFFIERELQFNRNSNTPVSPTELFPYGRVYTTNQMYLIGVSNLIGVDDWNSYVSSYNNQVTVVMQDSLSLALTNDAGVSTVNLFLTNVSETISPWSGYSFVMPFGTNMVVAQNLSLPSSPPSVNGLYAYYFSPTPVTFGSLTFVGPCFIPNSLDSANFLDAGTPPVPHFGLALTNWLQAYIIDTNNCILDYVQLGGINGRLDVNAAIADTDSSGLWSTNVFSGSTTPWGVVNQFNTSSEGGTVPLEDADAGGPGGSWATTRVPGAGADTIPAAQQAFFSAFFSPNDVAVYNGAYVTNVNLSILAPFTPMREIVERYVLQANDPLVHYLSSDLYDFLDDTTNRFPITHTNVIQTIGRLSDRYMPWGNTLPGEPNSSSGNHMPPVASFDGFPAQIDNNSYNLSYKDPLVWSSDYWNFPTNQTLNASWLGQVHRGTPWQTIYLKSTNILELQFAPPQFASGLLTWAVWTGDINLADAASMAPAADWQIAGLLASLFSTNNESSLFSANDPNPNGWENLLNGMTALTNNLPDLVLGFDPVPQFASLTISSSSSQAAEIANSIESARASTPRQFFLTPGNLFAVPQLSDESPYLNFADPAQVNYGINDLAYETIPDQLLPLLRVDSMGSTTTANGQVIIQFTGDDNHVYAVQVSQNLVNWATISTNCPVNGIFTFTNNVTAIAQFYRTVLLR